MSVPSTWIEISFVFRCAFFVCFCGGCLFSAGIPPTAELTAVLALAYPNRVNVQLPHDRRHVLLLYVRAVVWVVSPGIHTHPAAETRVGFVFLTESIPFEKLGR
jgi:hypothetical protein